MKIKTPKGEMLEYPQITGVPGGVPPKLLPGRNHRIPSEGWRRLPHPVRRAGPGSIPLRPGHRDRPEVDLSNAVAIVGIFAKGNSVMAEASSSGSIIVDVQGTRVKVQSGLVQTDAAAVKINGNVTITGEPDHHRRRGQPELRRCEYA